MSPGAVEVVLYGRPGCHLCDQARDQILAMAGEEDWDIDLVGIDIELEPELFREYLERIPVVAIGGRRVSELILDRAAIRDAIATFNA